MAFNFDELNGSPTYTFEPGESTARREGMIAWSDRFTAVSDIFPPTSVNSIGLGIGFPGLPWLRAARVRIEPFFDDQEPTTNPASQDDDFFTTNSYNNARLRIEYEALKAQPQQGNDPTRLLTHRWRAGGEYQTIDVLELQWANNDSNGNNTVSEDADPAIFIPHEEHEINWPRVLSPPFSTIRDRLGKVNSSSFQMETGTAKAETLLFLGAELDRDVMSDGTRAWNVTYRFSEKETSALDEAHGGWNHFFRSDPGKVGFSRMQTSASGKIYETASFTELFLQA